jgi:hypothetical protein
MSRRRIVVLTAVLAGLGLSGCTALLEALAGKDPFVRIKVVNDSVRQTVSPNIAVCPNGIENDPHHFVQTPPVLGPGESISYTTEEIAGTDGNCQTFATNFALGVCSWQFGSSRETLAPAASQRFGGQIGVQFQCGDTVILHWLDTDETGGSWTAEVITATGNQPPSAEFQLL